MKEMTEREEIERKILLQQQAIPHLIGNRDWVEMQKRRAEIRILRRQIWELLERDQLDGGCHTDAIVTPS